MLTEAVDAVRDLLGDVPSLGSVPSRIPAQLADERSVLVFATPGSIRRPAGTGANGRPLVELSALIYIERHLKVQEDRAAEADAETLPLWDATVVALWSAFYGDHFGGTIELLRSVDTDHYGVMGYGRDPTFGFRLSCDVTFSTEI